MVEEGGRGHTLNQFIDRYSPLRKTKDQILDNLKPPLPDYVKPPYHVVKKKQKHDMKIGQYKKFMEMLRKIQVNISLWDAHEQMSTYAKFMKDILSGKWLFEKDKNIALIE